MLKNETVGTAPCIASCPQGTDIRAVLEEMSQAGRRGVTSEQAFESAWRILTQTNPFPAVCGRVCPHPCESSCNRCDRDCAVGVRDVERFLGDWAISHNLKHRRQSDVVHPEKIAVIGSGPAGLSCA